MQMGVGSVNFSGKKRYEGVRFDVIGVTRGWVGVRFPGKKCYITLEWPLSGPINSLTIMPDVLIHSHFPHTVYPLLTFLFSSVRIMHCFDSDLHLPGGQIV